MTTIRLVEDGGSIGIADSSGETLYAFVDESQMLSAAQIQNKIHLPGILSKEKLDELDKLAWRQARSWYRTPSISGAYTYHDVKLPSLFELFLGNYFFKVLVITEAIKQMVSRYPDAKFVCEAAFAGDIMDFGGLFTQKGEKICQNILRHLCIPFELASDQNKSGKKPAASLKKTAVQAVRRVLGCLDDVRSTLVWLRRDKNKPTVAVAMGLHSCKELIVELKKRANVLYLEEEFRLAKWPDLMKLGVARVSLGGFGERTGIASAHGSAKNMLSDIRNDSSSEEAQIVCGELFESRLQFLLNHGFDTVKKWINLFENAVKKYQINAVVVDEDTVSWRKALVSAMPHPVLSVQIPHGINFEDTQYDLFPVSSKKVLVASADVAEFYKTQGVDAKKISVVGCPKFQNGPRLAQKDKDFVVFIASTPVLEFDYRRSLRQRNKAIEDVLGAVAENADILKNPRVIIKPHPLDSETHVYEQMLHKYHGLQIDLLDAYESNEVMETASVVFTFRSNIAFEGMLKRLPVFILNYFDKNTSHVPFLKDSALNVSSAAQVSEALKLAAGGAGLEKKIENDYQKASQWVGLNTANPNQKIAEEILKAMHETKIR